MKRILFFNDSLVLGGTEILLVDLLSHLATLDCDLTLLLPEPSENNILLNKLPSSVKVEYLYPAGTSYLEKMIGQNIMIFAPNSFSRMKKIYAKDYDLVVCFKEGFYARLFSKMKIRKILWIHNILYNHTYEIRSLKERLSVWLNKKQISTTRKSYDNYNKVICVSDACKQAYIEVLHNGIPPVQDIEILYNAIDLSKVVKKSEEPIAKLAEDHTKFILITRISPEKRTDRLIDAAARLVDEGYKFKVYIVGEGLDSSDMKELIKQRGLEDTITLTGRINNPYPYIRQCDWLLCVSERESFSLTLLESMAIGVPVITTNCGGPADIVDNGKYGLLVDNSGEGVYQGMKAVLDNPDLKEKYSSHLDTAIQRFDYKGWLKEVTDLLSIYN